ncbi:hypothetical protein QQM39_43175 [Streptomyces sp. DT2A-34]|uniref:hypothetical protein n=1 Tax=Streptomyces sp. DT2A-34 TaxID=3051182 RepID=UPI00265BA4F1|nr:hypothetical protein [Streptomyces sp. DT2A-34]MDO0917363.1 hypothetical protein [Streptomyces sp. DT2A-34]
MVSTLTSSLTAHAAPEEPRRTLALGHVPLVCAMVAFAAPALPTADIPAWPALVTAIVLFSLAEIFYAPAVGELSVTLTPSAARGSRQSLYQTLLVRGQHRRPRAVHRSPRHPRAAALDRAGRGVSHGPRRDPALKSPAPQGGRKRT